MEERSETVREEKRRKQDMDTSTPGLSGEPTPPPDERDPADAGPRDLRQKGTLKGD